MKEVIATARNITFTVGDVEVRCIVEAVLTVSEPIYELDPGGEVVRVRNPETLRFGASPSVLREIGKAMIDWAAHADKTCEMIAAGKIKMPRQDEPEATQ